MRIVWERDNGMIVFGDLVAGNCFEWNNNTYMKMEPVGEGPEEVNAVDLYDGETMFFSSAEVVTERDAEVRIKNDV